VTNSQQVRFGDVIGGNNTFNITQQQGASAEEIAPHCSDRFGLT